MMRCDAKHSVGISGPWLMFDRNRGIFALRTFGGAPFDVHAHPPFCNGLRKNGGRKAACH